MSLVDRIDALNHVFLERYSLVVATAGRFAPSPDLIDDIVQLVYIEFVHGGATKDWKLDQDFSPLLYVITKNKSHSLGRKKFRENRFSPEMLIFRLENALGNDGLSDVDEFEEILRRHEVLKKCVNLLSAKSRRLLNDHYQNGIPIRQIGKRESSSPSAIYRLFRAIRKNLKDCIQKAIEKR